MFNLRKIQSSEDIQKAREFLPESCAEPNWQSCVVLERDGEIIGFGGAHVVPKCDLYMKEVDPLGYLMLAAHMDGIFRQSGQTSYEFFVQDKFPQHQLFIEQHLPVEWDEEEPPKGKTYVRRFDGNP